MAENLIESRGFDVGRWNFPAFTLRLQESISLCFPREAMADMDEIVAALTGSRPVDGLKLGSKVIFAEPAGNPSVWRQWIAQTTTSDWLKQNTSLAGDDLAAFLERHRMHPRAPLSQYAGTPRLLLGLCAALARKPGVLVFSTAGLDPGGIREAFQFVAEHLLECSVIYLASPYISQDHQQYDSFPGSLKVAVTERESKHAHLVSPALESGSARVAG